MDENLIEEVKKKFVGYSPLTLGHLPELINKAKTINELLHVIHSYIINNEFILQSMPVIATKKNGVSRDSMVLYGEKTELAQKLFDAIPSDLDCGHTDIISMQDRILMMIRDRGHALTIDIDSSDEKGDILVKYFVPKLCNEEMIKKLPGVENISPNVARGMFICKEDALSKRLFDFIGRVPTDADIPETNFFINEYTIKENDVVAGESFNTFRIEEARQITMRS